METLQRTANRGSVSTGYDIDNSCKFEADNQEELLRTPSSAGNRQTWTVSMWFKFTELGIYQMLFGSSDTYMYLGNDDKMYINYRGATVNFFLATNRVFRDTTAFYHFVVVCDATNGTAADRGRFYVNGVRETDYQLNTYQDMDSGDSTHWNNTVAQSIGGQNGSTTFQSCGYMAEVHSVDGSALTADSFGEFDSDTGIWIPKAYSGSYGTNGFYFDFADADDLGDDESGNGNDFTETNITAADQATDTCTNNFCTWNPLWIYASNLTISQGGQQVFANASAWQGAKGSVGLQNGRWYWEVKIPSANNAGFTGIQTQGESNIGSGNAQSNNSTYCRKGDGNDIFYYGGSESTSNHGGGNMSDDNIIGVFLDLESSTKTLRWFKNGSSYGSTIDLASKSTSFTTREVFPFYANITDGNGAYFNFGGFSSFTISSAVSDNNGYGAFEYTPNDGTYDYYAICTKNLAEFG